MLQSIVRHRQHRSAGGEGGGTSTAAEHPEGKLTLGLPQDQTVLIHGVGTEGQFD